MRFLHISKGSNAEVKSMVYLAFRLNVIDLSTKEKALKMTNEIGKILNGLIKSLKA